MKMMYSVVKTALCYAAGSCSGLKLRAGGSGSGAGSCSASEALQYNFAGAELPTGLNKGLFPENEGGYDKYFQLDGCGAIEPLQGIFEDMWDSLEEQTTARNGRRLPMVTFQEQEYQVTVWRQQNTRRTGASFHEKTNTDRVVNIQVQHVKGTDNHANSTPYVNDEGKKLPFQTKRTKFQVCQWPKDPEETVGPLADEARKARALCRALGIKEKRIMFFVYAEGRPDIDGTKQHNGQLDGGRVCDACGPLKALCVQHWDIARKALMFAELFGGRAVPELGEMAFA